MEEGGVGGSEVIRKGVRRGAMPHLNGGTGAWEKCMA